MPSCTGSPMQPPDEEHVQRHLSGLRQDAGSQLAWRLCGAQTLDAWFPAAGSVNVGDQTTLWITS